MATSPLFGWEEPDDTDLVKDGAAAIRTLGNAIDTSMGDLLGGSTGQVLSKASNANMDFTWVTSDDANAIQNTIVDAKGDLISATGSDVPARLAVGNNGETLVADSSTSTGLRYTENYAAGKNKIINGDFSINQRGFTSTTTTSVFTFDRWLTEYAGGTSTFSAQTFTPGAAPVAGYESTNFIRIASTGQSAVSDNTRFRYKIEDVRTFAGQTVTLSFWAKAGSGTPSIAAYYAQVFGSGGSTAVTINGEKKTLSTSWARYTITLAIPSISGKTLGAGSYLELLFVTSAGSNYNDRTQSIGIQTATIDIWGVQVEAGSVATAFQTATGTIQGELAACQRYYWRLTPGVVSGYLLTAGNAYNATNLVPHTIFPQTMRVGPTSVDYSAIEATDGVNVADVTTLTLYYPTRNSASFIGATTGATQYRNYVLVAKTTSSYLGFSAEL
jgi:hypothetical protein